MVGGAQFKLCVGGDIVFTNFSVAKTNEINQTALKVAGDDQS